MDGGLTILKQLIDVFVDKITVYENEVVIAYNFLPQVNLPMIDEPARRRLKHFRAKENHPQNADDFGGEGNHFQQIHHKKITQRTDDSTHS